MADERREPADFFIRFCECLNRFDVRYVVVGSEAVARGSEYLVVG